jgi:hypothetical protein
MITPAPLTANKIGTVDSSGDRNFVGQTVVLLEQFQASSERRLPLRRLP